MAERRPKPLHARATPATTRRSGSVSGAWPHAARSPWPIPFPPRTPPASGLCSPASQVSGRRRRARLPSRWPPSAAQTERAVFPHSAFTKTPSRGCARSLWHAQVTGRATPLAAATPTGPAEGWTRVTREWPSHAAVRLSQTRASPRTRMYGYFTKGTDPPPRSYSTRSPAFPTAFAGRLPRPTPVAAVAVTRLSPRLRYYSAVRRLARHRFPLRLCL